MCDQTAIIGVIKQTDPVTGELKESASLEFTVQAAAEHIIRMQQPPRPVPPSGMPGVRPTVNPFEFSARPRPP